MQQRGVGDRPGVEALQRGGVGRVEALEAGLDRPPGPVPGPGQRLVADLGLVEAQGRADAGPGGVRPRVEHREDEGHADRAGDGVAAGVGGQGGGQHPGADRVGRGDGAGPGGGLVQRDVLDGRRGAQDVETGQGLPVPAAHAVRGRARSPGPGGQKIGDAAIGVGVHGSRMPDARGRVRGGRARIGGAVRDRVSGAGGQRIGPGLAGRAVGDCSAGAAGARCGAPGRSGSAGGAGVVSPRPGRAPPPRRSRPRWSGPRCAARRGGRRRTSSSRPGQGPRARPPPPRSGPRRPCRSPRR